MKSTIKLTTNYDIKSAIKIFVQKFYILLVLMIIYLPLIIIVLISFNGQTSHKNIILNFSSPNISNYIDLFNDDQFKNSLFTSLIISIIVVPISVLIATLTCFGIWNTNNKYANTIIGLSKLSIALPESITAISLAILFLSTFVPLGVDFGLFTICLAHISFCTPYAIITIYPRMQKMSKNLIWASYDLGYAKWKTFFKIVVPYLFPAILSGVAIVFAMSLDDFIITNLINGSTQTVSTLIYTTRKGIKAWIVTFGSILIIITFFIIFITFIYENKKNSLYKKTILSSTNNEK